MYDSFRLRIFVYFSIFFFIHYPRKKMNNLLADALIQSKKQINKNPVAELFLRSVCLFHVSLLFTKSSLYLLFFSASSRSHQTQREPNTFDRSQILLPQSQKPILTHSFALFKFFFLLQLLKFNINFYGATYEKKGIFKNSGLAELKISYAQNQQISLSFFLSDFQFPLVFFLFLFFFDSLFFTNPAIL